MTALRQYERLECQALWRAGKDAQRREVIVSFGDASLVISDRNEMALAHWSLPAVVRLNAPAMPALFSPAADGGETLEIDDRIMIEAIAKVVSAVARRRPRPGRLRLAMFGGMMAAIAALAVFWLPDALVRHTVSVVPAAKRTEIGNAVVSYLAPVTGQPCRTGLGAVALTRLKTRLGMGGYRLLVLRDGVPGSAHLPGGIILLNAALIEDYEDPAVAAAHMVLERLRSEVTDPLTRLLQHAGTLATFRLLTTGRMNEQTLRDYAETVLTAAPVKTQTTAFLEQLTASRVPSSPYAFARDPTGETTIELIEADPYRTSPAPPILSDSDWVGLQGICGE